MLWRKNDSKWHFASIAVLLKAAERCSLLYGEKMSALAAIAAFRGNAIV